MFPIDEIIRQFKLEGEYTGYQHIEVGHINSTFLLEFKNKSKTDKYILQRINVSVFKNPGELMQNIIAVTSFLKEKIAARGGDSSRETLDFLPAADGRYYFTDAEGRYWRCYRYVDSVFSRDNADPELFFNTGEAFGSFLMLLDNFPADSLFDTIPDFHDTRGRFAAFKKAVGDNLSGRRGNVEAEIEFFIERENDAGVIVDLLKSGGLPVRVTHNDTKTNNVLFDNETRKGVCVIDFDTVMKGSALYDFGDSIRFGASSAAEDEKDLSKVYFDLNLYGHFTAGYLGAARGALTDKEIELLPFSARLMTYECGMRFLTDYLNGDTYFKTAYPEHNLDRCRTHIKLIRDMESNYDEMVKITQKYK